MYSFHLTSIYSLRTALPERKETGGAQGRQEKTVIDSDLTGETTVCYILMKYSSNADSTAHADFYS